MKYPTIDSGVEPKDPQDIPSDVKIAFVDLLVQKKDLHEIKYALKMTKGMCKAFSKKLDNIYTHCVNLVLGKVQDVDKDGALLFTEEKVDGETVQTPVYVEVASLDELKTESFKKYTECAQDAFDYSIEKAIEIKGGYAKFVSDLTGK